MQIILTETEYHDLKKSKEEVDADIKDKANVKVKAFIRAFGEGMRFQDMGLGRSVISYDEFQRGMDRAKAAFEAAS